MIKEEVKACDKILHSYFFSLFQFWLDVSKKISKQVKGEFIARKLEFGGIMYFCSPNFMFFF